MADDTVYVQTALIVVSDCFEYAVLKQAVKSSWSVTTVIGQTATKLLV